MRTQKYHAIMAKRAGYSKPLSRLRLYVYKHLTDYKIANS